MTTRGLIDRSLLLAVDLIQAPELANDTILDFQRTVDEAIAHMPLPEGPVEIWRQTIAGIDGHTIGLIVFVPESREIPGPAVLQIHGGGYVMGNAGMGNAGNFNLALATGAIVVAVDYRLAPTTPYPGALEDCYAALVWVYDHARELGIETGAIAIKGESAGGGLAAGLALLARDRGGPPICHQNLIYPMLDDRTASVREPHSHTGEFVWTAENNRFGWQALLGQPPGGHDVEPYAAPARAADVENLPPTFIAVGTLDLFMEENISYAQSLLRAGVPTELHVYPGAYHGFDFAAESPLTHAMAKASVQALVRAFDH